MEKTVAIKTKSISKINLNLECLRGFAALFVVMAHIINLHDIFNKNYYIPSSIYFVRTWEVSHISVLIFFVLSGYVIGISNKNNLEKGTILNYLKKRVIRLYPIYFICILVTISVAKNLTFKMVFGTLTFTQGMFTGVIEENGALWSLNYEFLYYLLFIPISFFNFKPITVLASSLSIATVSHFILPNYPIISSYFFGFTFWTTGLCIARYLDNKNKIKVSHGFLVGCLFYLVSISALLNYGIIYRMSTFIDRYFLYPITAEWYTVMIPIRDLVLLPYCFCFVIIFSGLNFKFKNTLFLILQIFPLLGIYDILKFEKDHKSLIIPVVYYFISMAIFVFNDKINDKIFSPIIRFGIWLGTISYAIYVIHFPMLYLFSHVTASSSVLFACKVILFLSVLFGLSFFLEKRFQMWVKELLTNKDVLKEKEFN